MKINITSRATQLAFGLAITVVSTIILAGSANAATFTVNTTDDGNDVNPGDGICEVNAGQDDCGIRALIEETNALGGADIGNFNIPGAGVQTFTPASAYPAITDQLSIDGSTQPGASCGTLVPASLPATSNTPHTLLIEVDGTNGSPFNDGLLSISSGSDNTIIRGLIVNRATNFSKGIIINSGVTGVTVECNYIGTNSNGDGALANIQGGIDIQLSTGVTIQNNLISGNNGDGINISSSNTTTIQGNIIGLSANGEDLLANGSGLRANDYGVMSGFNVTNNIISGNNGDGIGFYNTADLTITGNFVGTTMNGSAAGNGANGMVIFGVTTANIGGANPSLRNVFSANTENGVNIYENCNGSGRVQYISVIGNFIGTDVSGNISTGFGNQASGININEYHGGCKSVFKNTIGGDNTGEPNIIAGNTLDGIRIYQSNQGDVFSNAFMPNNIFGNGNLGINLAFDSDDDGIADADLGPNVINAFLMSYPATNANYYINHPTINSASNVGNQVTVNYNYQANGVQDNDPSILSSNLVGYRLDFYLNDAGQDGAYGGYSQGKTHIGSFIVNGSESNSTHVFTSPVTPSSGQVITATATVLWQIIPDPGTNCQGDQWGDGPPYNTTCIQ